MDRQEAIKALVMAGRGKEVEEVISKTVSDANQMYADVRADGSRTDSWKRQELAQVAAGYNAKLTETLVKMAGTAVRSDRGDAASVFGVDGIAGDPASLVISRRDAGDRVAGIQNSSELRDLLSRATRSGDEVLARAVAERALEMRDAKTLEKFAEDRPHLDSAVERLWDGQQRQDDASSAGMSSAMMLVALKPNELAGMSFGSIEAMANAQ